MNPGWIFSDADKRLAEELREFPPARVFDAHAHFWDEWAFGEAGAFSDAGPQRGTFKVWRDHLAPFFPDSNLIGGLFMPVCHPAGDDPLRRLDAANRFLLRELQKAPDSRGHLFIAPEYPVETVVRYLENPHVVGFKPYHTWSRKKPTWQAPMHAYLPEWAWELADERGLTITLHMVRDRAIADPVNQREIREMCTKYPNARLILAHGARCFHAPNAAGLSALRGLTNVWFDTSAICEAAPLVAILKEFGTKRIMWGSDFPVCEIRGRSVTIGDGFAWVQFDTLDWKSSQVPANPVLVGLESLRALREAAGSFGLNRRDIEDVFCNNALRLLGMVEESDAVTQELHEHTTQRIPGGTQLLSRRPELFALLGRLPDRNRPISCEKVGETDGGSYILEKLSLDLNGMEAVPAFFTIPKERRTRAPAILYNHSHGGGYEIGKKELTDGREYLQDPPYAEALAARGVCALCIDAWAFGERHGKREEETFKEFLWRGHVMWGMMVYDGIRALDYLVTRNEVDPNRIGTLGISMGSTMAWWLAALDERIGVCVDICCLTDFHTLVESRGLSHHGIYYYVPDLLNHFSTAEINALIAPRPHLALAGNKDPLTPPAGLDRIDAELKKVYAEAGAPDAWRLLRYDVGHMETADMRSEVFTFLDRYLIA